MWFPQKNGCRAIRYTHPDFPEHLKDSDLTYYTRPHRDKDKSFFFWKDYSIETSYEEHREDPEYMISHWRLFVLDGASNFWNGDKPDYSTGRGCLQPNYDDDDLLKSPIENVPISCFAPEDETATDYNRRQLHYCKEKCSWALIDNCVCSSSGVCSKIEKRVSRFDEEFNCETMISLLGARMSPVELPSKPENDEFMYTFCSA